jgi:hypothetical protein
MRIRSGGFRLWSGQVNVHPVRVPGSGFRQERGDHGLGCGELSGAPRKRTFSRFRVRGHTVRCRCWMSVRDGVYLRSGTRIAARGRGL